MDTIDTGKKMSKILRKPLVQQLMEVTANIPIYCDGISVAETMNGLVHLVMWVEQPCLEGGTERVVTNRLVMTEAAHLRDAISNRERVEKQVVDVGSVEYRRIH